MADRMTYKIREMLNKRKLTRIKPDRKLILKEMRAAASDLKDAEDSFSREKFKWATVQAYYSMFHAARALLYSQDTERKATVHC